MGNKANGAESADRAEVLITRSTTQRPKQKGEAESSAPKDLLTLCSKDCKTILNDHIAVKQILKTMQERPDLCKFFKNCELAQRGNAPTFVMSLLKKIVRIFVASTDIH